MNYFWRLTIIFALCFGTTKVTFAQKTKAEIKAHLAESLALFQAGDTLGAFGVIDAIGEQDIASIGDSLQWNFYDQAAALNLFYGNDDKALKFLNLIIPLQEKTFQLHTPYYYQLQKKRFQIEYVRGNNDRALVYLQELLVRCDIILARAEFEDDRQLLYESLELLLKLNGIEL